jgi:tetratricopeptide (TPR) repeat protein
VDAGARLADRGQWDEAAIAYARGIAIGEPGPELWFDHAILRLAIGEEAGYRSACRHLLDVLRGHDDQTWLEFTAHACALGTQGPAEAAQALQLAERRAALIPHPWSEHVLGLALYRAGRFAEADTCLRSSLALDPRWFFQVLDWLALALVDQRLGRPDEARRWLATADRWIEAGLTGRPGGVERAIPENWRWRDGILLHLLHREAHALIRELPPTLPADVFAPAR